jgi:hypothetical protein
MLAAGRIVLLLAVLLLGGGRLLLDASLPAMSRVFAWVAPDFRLLVLQAQAPGALPGVQAMVTLARPTQVGAYRAEPHPDGFATAQLRLGQVLQAPLLAGLLLLGWPGGALPVLLKRLALALGPLALLWVIDTPVVLAGLLWELLLEAHAPGSRTALTRAGDFLNGGGRLALAAAIAAAAIAAAAPARLGQVSLRS